jgi:hypothetical protein
MTEPADVTLSWVTTEVREYKITVPLAELHAHGLAISGGQLTQADPPRSHWETPDRFLASRESDATRKAGYTDSRSAEVFSATPRTAQPAGQETRS